MEAYFYMVLNCRGMSTSTICTSQLLGTYLCMYVRFVLILNQLFNRNYSSRFEKDYTGMSMTVSLLVLGISKLVMHRSKRKIKQKKRGGGINEEKKNKLGDEAFYDSSVVIDSLQ